MAAASSADKDMPAPRDLQQLFQQSISGPGSELSPEQMKQRIIQLELALTSVTKHNIAQERTIQKKEGELKNLQDMLYPIESENQDEQFEDVDEGGMQGASGAYPQSQQWRSASPFFDASTPVPPPRPLYAVSEVPNAPRTQQPIKQQDMDTEVDTIKKKLLDMNELMIKWMTSAQQQAEQARAQPQPNEATMTLMLAMVEELKHSRCAQDIKFKQVKDITDEVTIVLALRDWERTFAQLRMKPSVSVVLDKIVPGGNLWKWYQSQCTRRDPSGKIQEHELIDNWSWEEFKNALLSSHLHKEPNYAEIRAKFDTLTCPSHPSTEELKTYIANFENTVQTLRINDMIDDYPESRIAQKFFDGLPSHVKRAIFVMPGATRVDPKDPTRRTNYAATKADLVYLLASDWGEHQIKSAYDDHIQKSNLTVAGSAATHDTVKHTTRRHIGSPGQFRITIIPKSTGQYDTTDNNSKLERIAKRLQELKAADRTLEFKEYTSKSLNQAFLIVHNLEATLQSVSNDHILLSIGIRASPPNQITARPLSPITTQTVSAAANTFLQEQTNDLTTDVSRANTDVNSSPSPTPSASTVAAPEREYQAFTPPVPASSKGLFTHSRRANVCVVSSKDLFKKPSCYGTACIIPSAYVY
jgi:hypothetical protein